MARLCSRPGEIFQLVHTPKSMEPIHFRHCLCYPKIRHIQNHHLTKLYIDYIMNTSQSQVDTSSLPFPTSPPPRHSVLGERDTAFLTILLQPLSEKFLHLSLLDIPYLKKLLDVWRNCQASEDIFLPRDTYGDIQLLFAYILRCYSDSKTVPMFGKLALWV